MTTAAKRRPATAWTIAAPDLRAALTAVAPAISAKHVLFSGVRLGAYGAEAFYGELRVLVDLEGAGASGAPRRSAAASASEAGGEM